MEIDFDPRARRRCIVPIAHRPRGIPHPRFNMVVPVLAALQAPIDFQHQFAALKGHPRDLDLVSHPCRHIVTLCQPLPRRLIPRAVEIVFQRLLRAGKIRLGFGKLRRQIAQNFNFFVVRQLVFGRDHRRPGRTKTRSYQDAGSGEVSSAGSSSK